MSELEEVLGMALFILVYIEIIVKFFFSFQKKQLVLCCLNQIGNRLSRFVISYAKVIASKSLPSVKKKRKQYIFHVYNS